MVSVTYPGYIKVVKENDTTKKNFHIIGHRLAKDGWKYDAIIVFVYDKWIVETTAALFSEFKIGKSLDRLMTAIDRYNNPLSMDVTKFFNDVKGGTL